MSTTSGPLFCTFLQGICTGLDRLTSNEQTVQQQWRRQHGLPTDGRADREPQLISLRDTATLPDAKFCAPPLAAAEAAQPKQPGGSSIPEGYGAFMGQLPQLPASQALLAAGAAESRFLAALLSHGGGCKR